MHILNLPGFPRSNVPVKKKSCMYFSYQLMLDVYHMQCLQNNKSENALFNARLCLIKD